MPSDPEELARAHQAADAAYGTAYAALTKAHEFGARAQRIQMLALADQRPDLIDAFRYDVELESDDEGGTMESISIYPEGREFEDGFDEISDEASLMDTYGVAAVMLAFESDDEWKGRITVARLRQLLTPEAANDTSR